LDYLINEPDSRILFAGIEIFIFWKKDFNKESRIKKMDMMKKTFSLSLIY